jgi:hypothetical protein
MSFNAKELDIIKVGAQNGKNRQEIENALSNYRNGIVPQKQVVEEQKSSPIISALKGETSFLASEGGITSSAIPTNLAKTFGNIPSSAAKLTAPVNPLNTESPVNISGNIVKSAGALSDIFKTVDPIQGAKSILGGFADTYLKIGETIYGGLDKAYNALLDDPKKAIAAATSNLAKIGIEDPMFIPTLLYGGGKLPAGKTDLITKIASPVTQGADTSISGMASKVASKVTSKVEEVLSPLQSGEKLLEDVKLNLASKNVEPRVQQSAQRLGDISSQTKPKTKAPTATYDEFIKQEQKFKTNIKEDTALGLVGERTGNAFDSVVAQRRAIGKKMGDELKKVGNTPTDTSDAFGNFRTNLQDSGVVYDALEGKIKPITAETKFTNEDLGLLENYAKSIQALGKNPTVSNLDAFLSRIPSELNVYKTKSGIVGTTNAERIIKGSLSELRKSIETGNPALKPYLDARKAYSELSDFLEEGQSFLGKKTQAGDYAKDASLTKSAVQSILNQGKKDWLVKLEGLTGYPALDEAVLALQAMKDAGNFRGLSLLETLSQGGIPTTKGGITQKIVDFMLEKGAKAFTGTPEQQTKAFLQFLEREAKTKSTAYPKANTTPKTGESTIKINQSKKPI